MPAVILTEQELDALAGIPHACIALYIALRRRMDGATGLVGAPHLVSWQALKESVYVEPRPGVGCYSPTRWTLLRLAQWLVKAGLVEMRSNAAQHQLIVHMKKAPVRSLVQKKAARNPHQNPHVVPHRGNPQEPALHPPPKAARHLESILPTVAAFSGADGDTQGKAQKLDWQSSYPQGYSQAEQAAILKVAYEKRMDRDRLQLLLEEMAGKEKNALIKNRPAFFLTLVRQSTRGTFFGKKAALERSYGTPLSPEEIDFQPEGGLQS